MFREMRRNRQLMPNDEAKRLLLENSTGTLALLGDDGYPYSLPINYFYDGEDKLYFHCAKQGHKLDAIRNEHRVSMSVIARDEVCQEKFTTLFESVVIFGKARIIDDQDEINRLGSLLAKRICPDNEANISAEISSGAAHMYIVEITIEHMTGKKCIELVKD